VVVNTWALSLQQSPEVPRFLGAEAERRWEIMTSWRQDEDTSAQTQRAHPICDQQQQTQTVSQPHTEDGEKHTDETHTRQQAARGADDTCLRKQVGFLKTSKVTEEGKRPAVIKRVQTMGVEMQQHHQSEKNRQVSDQRRKLVSDQHKKVHSKLSAKERLAGKDVEHASSTMTARLAGTLSVALVVGLGFYKYGLYVALASGGWPVFFMTVLMAFEDTTRGMCVQASALALALGVIVGAAALQRHDYPVLVALSITIMVCMTTE
jgi:thiol:disulfide interchange protein